MRGVVNTFSRGEIDQRALAREDIKRVNSSSSSMINFIPSRLGNMVYRQGTEYIASLDNSNDHHFVPFVAAIDDTALLDFYNDKIEFIVNDTPITVSSVTTVFVNSDFTSNITGWTDNSGGGASTAWYNYGGGDGALALTGDGSANAISYDTITTDTGNEHFMRVVVDRAPVVLKVGTSGVSSFEIFSGTLKPGEHVITFTPGSNITVTFENSKKYRALINSVDFDSGSANLVTDTAMTAATMDSLRVVQSIDVVFCAFDGGAPFQIEHRGDKSWSVVDYRSDDGPFESINDTNITLTAAALNGDTTLTASEDFFVSGHVGALFKLASAGQKVNATVTVDTGAGTNSVLVTGTGTSRSFTFTATGFSSGTVTMQRSSDDASWTDVQSYTSNRVGVAFNDSQDNVIYYYRLWVKAGDNGGADTLVLEIDYPLGSIEGIGRVTKYTSTTVVDVQVLADFGSTDAVLEWYEGSWSTANKFPSSVEISEGRLLFAGKDENWGSVSDAYFSFDRGIEGDSASILRTIGFGPEETAKWIKAAGQLIIGNTMSEVLLRSSSYGDILTQNTANIRLGSTQGSANIEPVVIDNTIYFVQRSGIKLYSLDNFTDRDTFNTVDATVLNQDICDQGVHRLAFTVQPETRIFVVLNDGNVAVYTVDLSEEVAGWSRLQMTGGTIKDVVVLPGTDEDQIYFVVERGSNTYLEKLAKFKASIGGTISETFDSFLRYTSPGTSIATAHIANGDTVGVWADGQDRGTYTVTAGAITVGSSWTDVIVGLPYTADYVSNKLSGYDKYTVLTERKRPVDVGLVLMNTWPGAVTIGPSVALLKGMPGNEDGTAVDTTVTITDYSEEPFEFDGESEADPRIYIRATGPATILALTYDIEGERSDSTSD